MAELFLDEKTVNRAKAASLKIAWDVKKEIDANTTMAVERAVLRLLGVEGETADGVPLVNIIVDKLLKKGELNRGAAFWLVNAILVTGKDARQVAKENAAGQLDLTQLPEAEFTKVRHEMIERAKQALIELDKVRYKRDKLLSRLGEGEKPLRYLIVATGNIHEDVLQAQAAVRQGADIIAVIRHTAQSLFDYVPSGMTTEGVGGTLATRENFRVMRHALDETGEEVGRYIYLTNYCSGLCMPEMAVLGALERLDIMLNDSMYGIIFRDINMLRTFIDQDFSRAILSYADIMINTGEDNYLTTADAYEKAHTVVASQFINLRFAVESGLKAEQVGLGHAFEISPKLEDSFLFELAQAQLVRQLFPKNPVKYMPPTKHMTGNIFQGNVQNVLFNAASVITNQSVHLLGMPTEAVHTPHVHDRYLSLENTDYVFKAMKHLGAEIQFAPDGLIQKRASEVLENAAALLEEIAAIGLMTAISQGMFADIARQKDGGKGLDGVVKKSEQYYNPFEILVKRKEAHDNGSGVKQGETVRGYA
ncbi:lysine 5,6-aminomutase subunit alpha [Metallumcola ferriviriculae]|uniref:Lysine 5,6-aminomutase subunit alpha n=1 Tax=Metallumcola ferriviriculae TaxID=3039180 RepID=A0AAU0UQC4_9FIRM|nr:lysine 5,6-aminomutase subunit alpha [Desulfitibacteraceae bacterium MK1]